MGKVPFVFQNAVREVYFKLLERFVEDEGLVLDLENYNEDSILAKRKFRSSETVAIIDSHSSWGELNDLTNEMTPRGPNGRTYDGLKIIIWNNKYREKIERISDNMSRQLVETVIIKDRCSESVVVKGI